MPESQSSDQAPLLTPNLMLPCHSLEDFPTYLTGNDADQVLMAWTILWDPRVLFHLKKIPKWFPDDQVPPVIKDQAFLLLDLEDRSIDPYFKESLEEEGAFFFHLPSDRTAALAKLTQTINLPPTPDFSSEIIQEFYALSYTFLQVELICRQLRYSEGVDHELFESRLLQCLESPLKEDKKAFNESVTLCYDLLCDERLRFYPSDPLITDLTLTGPTTNRLLEKQLKNWPAFTLQTNAKDLSQFQRSHPEGFDLLKNRVANKSVEITSPGWIDLPNILATPENLKRNISLGNRWYTENFSWTPKVYSQRTNGLENHLPGLLAGEGFQGALYQSFDGLRPPNPGETSFRWEGMDGSVLMAIGKQSIDGNQSSSILRFGTTFGQILDEDHLAAIQLTHWPSTVCPFYWDLITSLNRSSALGKLTPLSEVLENLHDPGYTQLDPLQTQPNWLLKQFQSIAKKTTNTTSREINQALQSLSQHYQFRRQNTCDEILISMSNLLGIKSTNSHRHAEPYPESENQQPDLSFPWLVKQLDEVTGSPILNDEDRQQIASKILEKMIAINRPAKNQNDSDQSKSNPTFFLNSTPTDRLTSFTFKNQSADRSFSIPGGGFSFSSSKDIKQPTSRKQGFFRKPVQQVNIACTENFLLRNEHLEAAIDPASGSIRSIRYANERANLLSWQLAIYDPALRKIARTTEAALSGPPSKGLLGSLKSASLPPAGIKEVAAHRKGYSKMECTSIEVVQNSNTIGLIKTTGQLKILDQPIASFALEYQLTKEQKSIEIRGAMTLLEKASVQFGSTEKKYYWEPTSLNGCLLGSRLAYGTGTIYANHNGFLNRQEKNLLYSPEYFEVAGKDHRFTITSQQASIHKAQDVGEIFSVAQLPEHAGQTVPFSNQIGIDCPSPESLAFDSIPPIIVQDNSTGTKIQKNGWLVSNSNPKIRIAWWKNRYDHEQWTGIELMVSNQTKAQQKTVIGFAKPIGSIECYGPDETTSSQVQINDPGMEILLLGYETLTIKVTF